MKNKTVIVQIDCDERYPFYNVQKAERLIGGTACGMKNNKWELKTIDDVLKMSWLDFYDIPKEKYDWIQSVYTQLEAVEKYIQDELFKPKRENTHGR